MSHQMDYDSIDYLGKGGGKKGKDKEKGKDKGKKKFMGSYKQSQITGYQAAGGDGDGTPNCEHCGRKIKGPHAAWDCWYNPRNRTPEAVAARAKKATRDAQGAAGGKAGSALPTGQTADDKPKQKKGKGRGKGVNSLEHQAWPDQPEKRAGGSIECVVHA